MSRQQFPKSLRSLDLLKKGCRPKVSGRKIFAIDVAHDRIIFHHNAEFMIYSNFDHLVWERNVRVDFSQFIQNLIPTQLVVERMEFNAHNDTIVFVVVHYGFRLSAVKELFSYCIERNELEALHQINSNNVSDVCIHVDRKENIVYMIEGTELTVVNQRSHSETSTCRITKESKVTFTQMECSFDGKHLLIMEFIEYKIYVFNKSSKSVEWFIYLYDLINEPTEVYEKAYFMPYNSNFIMDYKHERILIPYIWNSRTSSKTFSTQKMMGVISGGVKDPSFFTVNLDQGYHCAACFEWKGKQMIILSEQYSYLCVAELNLECFFRTGLLRARENGSLIDITFLR